MIKTICCQAFDNAHLFKSLVASMHANIDHRHYRGMVETLLHVEGNVTFRYIVLQEVLAYLVADLLSNDIDFQTELPQAGWLPHPDAIASLVIDCNVGCDWDVKPILGIIGNVERDHLRTEVRKAIESLLKYAANNSDTRQQN